MCKDPENNCEAGKIASDVKGLIQPGLWYDFIREYEEAHTPAPLLIEWQIFEILGLTDKGRNEVLPADPRVGKPGLRRQAV